MHQATKLTARPVAIYHVSGEYLMMKMQTNLENEIFDELHSGFARSGASFVIGYAAKHFLRWKNSDH